MRTMSWSRYHTFTRIPTHLRRRAAKRLRLAAKATTQAATQDSATRSEPERQSGATPGGFARGFLAGISQSLTRIFRTRRLRNRTDI
jgi:hypothetical protein